jgi:hypothetical protein
MLCYLEATGLNVGCRGHELACHGVSNYIFGCNKAAGSKADKGQPLATQGTEEHAGHEQDESKYFRRPTRIIGRHRLTVR